jgi:hypothetical protein
VGSQTIHAGHCREVYAKDSIQISPQIETWLVPPRLGPVLGWREELLARRQATFEFSQEPLDFPIAVSHPRLVLPVSLERLTPHQKMLGTVAPEASRRDGFFTGHHPWVAPTG